MNIPPVKPYFSQEDINYIFKNFRDILEGKSFLSQYKFCKEFEERFADYVGSKFAATTSNATASLEIIFRALDVEGYEVIVPTQTFASTAFAVIHAGGKPVFVDSTRDMTVDPYEVKKKINNKTKAVVTVHLGGLVSPNTKEIVEICEEKDIPLVEDAAQAHGSFLENKHAGTFGTAGAFSFFSTKLMTTGEGGMITTDDEEIYEESFLIRNQAKENNKNYHKIIGHNWRMTEVQALLGIKQLESIDKFVNRRKQLAKIYDKEFESIPGFTPLEIPKKVKPNYYKYVVFTPKGFDKDTLRQELRTKYNVSLGGYIYELPCHLQPVFQEYSHERLPVSEELCERHICPPMYYEMTDEEALYVMDSLRRCVI